MPAKGKHRRPKNNPLARGIAVAGTGGAALVLPVIGATTAGAAPNAAQSLTAQSSVTSMVAAAPKAAKKAGPGIYRVVPGDSLSKIATEHSLTGGWKRLYQDNRRAIGGNPSLIRPGLKLTIAAEPSPAEAAKAKAKTPKRAAEPERADRSTRTSTLSAAPAAAKSATTYADNLDGWIRESLDIMAKHGIPGSYDGIHRNIMRESSGNPLAINNWDSNAMAGIPSKGLLQVIDPTFQAYHVPGTSMDSYDPVANITAACNYAAARYGSIDNVNGPY